MSSSAAWRFKVTPEEAIERFDRANAALQGADHASVSVGTVLRDRGEGLASLIGRADAAMYERREKLRG